MWEGKENNCKSLSEWGGKNFQVRTCSRTEEKGEMGVEGGYTAIRWEGNFVIIH